MSTYLPNLAKHSPFSQENIQSVSAQIEKELQMAHIEAHKYPGKSVWFERQTEVPSQFIGGCFSWTFKRAWNYYVAEGPGIPSDLAEEFHAQWGKEVRVDGHCGCPSPLEWFKGFACGHYHIDTQEGLNAFVELLKSIWKN